MPEQHLESDVPMMSSIFVALAALRDSFCSDLSLARKVATVLAPTKRLDTCGNNGEGGPQKRYEPSFVSENVSMVSSFSFCVFRRRRQSILTSSFPIFCCDRSSSCGLASRLLFNCRSHASIPPGNPVSS